jgi:septal ring factor EnvC (AmiA/AmiB activator)
MSISEMAKIHSQIGMIQKLKETYEKKTKDEEEKLKTVEAEIKQIKDDIKKKRDELKIIHKVPVGVKPKQVVSKEMENNFA